MSAEEYDAAEREMDLYRAEIARVTTERDKYRDALAEVRTALLDTGRHFADGRGPIAIIDRAIGRSR